MSLLELIFPKKCVGCNKLGSFLCQGCCEKIETLRTQICPFCYKNALRGQTHPACFKKDGLDGIISFYYYRGPVRALIKNLKYRFTTSLLSEVGKKLAFDENLLPSKTWALLPVPLTKQKQNYRGFNQAELLGKLVAEKLGLAVEKEILKKIKPTKSQVGLSRVQRRLNIEKSFEVVGKVKGQSFYIFDDVWTSGATLKVIARELKKAGAEKVWGLTLAHPH